MGTHREDGMKRKPKRMTRRNVHLPDRTWEQLQEYADELSEKEGRLVTASEAVRRILTRSLARVRPDES